LKSKRRSGPTSVATRFHSPADFGRCGYYLIDDVLEKLNAAVACFKRIAINHFPHLAVFHEKPGTENDFRLNVATSVSVPKE
jgi:hypothetical protein